MENYFYRSSNWFMPNSPLFDILYWTGKDFEIVKSNQTTSQIKEFFKVP